LMANNGWNLETIFRLMISEVNGLENASGSEDLVPQIVPQPTPFAEMARIAGSIRRQRLVTMASIDQIKAVSPPIASGRVDGTDLVRAVGSKLEYRPTEEGNDLVLTRSEPGYQLAFSPSAFSDPEVEAFRRLLRLAPTQLEFPIRRVEVPGGIGLLPLPDGHEKINIRIRTLLDMLIYLSKGVEVPDEHTCRGLAKQTIGPDGTVFDWTTTTRGVFHVAVQRKRPKAADVAIEYRGYWYYIPESDKSSKATLALMQSLFNLQLSEPKKGGPLLTLPVGL
ncbi:MAG: hypothetical protein U0794_22940, partial [Isosphaeraceae bacterium]